MMQFFLLTQELLIFLPFLVLNACGIEGILNYFITYSDRQANSSLLNGNGYYLLSIYYVQALRFTYTSEILYPSVSYWVLVEGKDQHDMKVFT